MNFTDTLSLPDGPKRTTALVAWVQGLYSDRETTPVLVGGAAVEILTGGAYTTGDLDFAGSVGRNAEVNGSGLADGASHVDGYA